MDTLARQALFLQPEEMRAALEAAVPFLLGPGAGTLYIVVQGHRIGHQWVESPIFDSAWNSHGDAEHFRQQAIRDGLGGQTDIRVKRMHLRPDLGLPVESVV
jgi:hypothetical protein